MVSLTKNQAVSLTKTTGSKLSEVSIGLGWDPIKKEKGFFGKIFGGSDAIDLDASCILLTKDREELECIFFNQLQSACGSIQHQGDNLTGEGDGDDEVIHANLAKLSDEVHYLAITVNSFRGQTFNEVENAFCRLVDKNSSEICRYQLADKGAHTGILIASFCRQDDDWIFTAHGLPCKGRSIQEMIPEIRNALTTA